MGSFNIDWGSWAAAQIGAAAWTDDTLATANTDTGDAISLDEKQAVEISIKVVYHASSTAAVTVYVLRDTDGTNYEAITDAPWAFTMPFTAGGTHYKTFTVDAAQASSFKVAINNAGGQTVTNTVKQRFATGLTA